MANQIKWSTPASAVTNIRGDATSPTLKNLANDARKLGSEYDNATDKNQYADFELYVRGAAAFSAGGFLSLFLIPTLDATNYSDGDDSTDPPSTSFVGVFPVRAVNTQQRIHMKKVQIPPFKFKPLIINKGGQALTNTDNENILTMRTYNDEVQ